ncbi:MAG: hypothetical protein K9J17_03250 [Flavobacteriales bacterium]|nr:hypothetical protein [Flavobacteriales bacterium]
MGLNIQGVATSHKGAGLSEIAEIISIEVSKKLSDCTFEEALSNGVAANDIYFIQTNKGAMIIAGEDFPVMEIPMKALSENDGKTVKFMYGETSMVFYFEYHENGAILRRKIVVEGETSHEAGKALDIEHSGIEVDEVITQLMLRVSGDDINTIELDHPIDRHRYIGRKETSKPSNQSNQTAPNSGGSIDEKEQATQTPNIKTGFLVRALKIGLGLLLLFVGLILCISVLFTSKTTLFGSIFNLMNGPENDFGGYEYGYNAAIFVVGCLFLSLAYFLFKKGVKLIKGK